MITTNSRESIDTIYKTNYRRKPIKKLITINNKNNNDIACIFMDLLADKINQQIKCSHTYYDTIQKNSVTTNAYFRSKGEIILVWFESIMNTSKNNRYLQCLGIIPFCMKICGIFPFLFSQRGNHE